MNSRYRSRSLHRGMHIESEACRLVVCFEAMYLVGSGDVEEMVRGRVEERSDV
jgi:hypothetical protein